MLEALEPTPPDTIVKLIGMFAGDRRANKVDLGVGVYRTAEGRTPVLRAVKAAEKRIWETQDTKSYTALAGDPAFRHALADLVLGAGADWDRVAALATPGGTGAVRQGIELALQARPDATIWLPEVTWANHHGIASALGATARTYRYLGVDGGLDAEGLLQDVRGVPAGDVIVLHGCCHNPTGVDLPAEIWAEIAAICGSGGAVPMVDLAYQGFGDGLDADAAGLRILAAALPEVLIAVSCSKTFGLYRDRAGLLLVQTSGTEAASRAQGALERLNRVAFAFPPDHGARVVTEILTDAALRRDWSDELTTMRDRINAMRAGFAQALAQATGEDRFGWLAGGRGMFTRLPLTETAVARLREDAGIYLIEDGRANIAGLTDDTLGPVARAMARAGI